MSSDAISPAISEMASLGKPGKYQCFTSQQEPEAQPDFWFHGSFDNNTGTLDRTPHSVNK
jgi:hypothetical protein